MAVALYAAMLCFLAYNFFFTEPRFTFYIDARRGRGGGRSLFLVAAWSCGRLAAQLRAQVRACCARPTTHARALQTLAGNSPRRPTKRRWSAPAARRSRRRSDATAIVLLRDGGDGRRLQRSSAQSRPASALDAQGPRRRRLGGRPRAARRPLHRHAVRLRRGGSCRWSVERRLPGRGRTALPGVATRARAPEQRRLAEAMVAADRARRAIAPRLVARSRDGARRRRDRAPAHRAAVVGVARPALAAGVDHRRRREPVGLRRRDARGGSPRAARRRSAAKASASTATSRTCST